ncbi:MAG: M48 family metallopeptidase [Kiritimatiellae bacterium]|nr:M48 family metallopeptidase [Kiritimatiellia bacterium]
MKNTLLPLTALAVAAVALAACSTVPITGRSRLNFVPDSEVLSTSLTEYSSFMEKATVSSDRAGCAMVERVGRRIAAATEKYLRNNGLADEVKNFQWEFNLVVDKEVNAWCMPGGKIVVYEGLMKLVGNDDELAVVLGHEVAHAVAKHSNERMSQQVLAQAGGAALGFATAATGQTEQQQQLAATVFGLGTQYGVLMPFSRRHESEADSMGLVLMTIAGYDPGAALTFWQKMAASSSSSTPEFLSTHPGDKSRIEALRKQIPTVRAQYSP